MTERPDVRFHDRVALDEIELYAEVLSAVAASDRPLTAHELDTALGIARVSAQREPARPGSPAAVGVSPRR